MEKNKQNNQRRAFLKSLAGLTAGMMLPLTSINAEGKAVPTPYMRDRLGDLLPKRKFGKSGLSVTMLGLGGAHIARMKESEAERTIERLSLIHI